MKRSVKPYHNRSANTMKVKELAAWLKECNQDAEIEISVDVSKGDEDFGNRVYADISEVLVMKGNIKSTIVAVETSRNF